MECFIVCQNVMQEDWFAIFKFKIPLRAHTIKHDCFYNTYLTSDLFTTTLNWYETKYITLTQLYTFRYYHRTIQPPIQIT